MERLLETLRNAGLPVQYLTGSSKDDVNIVYSSDPTEETKQAVVAILADFDWSPEAEQVWLIGKKKAEAVSLVDGEEPNLLLLRNSQKIVLMAFTGVINKLNEIIASHNEKTGASLEAYAQPKTWDELVGQLKYLITIE